MKLFSIVCITLSLWMSIPLFAYQNSSFSLATPTDLAAGEGEIAISHRFYGQVDDDTWNTLFGINQGANVGLAASYNLPYQSGLKFGYTRQKSQTAVGGYWQIPQSSIPLQAKVDITWKSFLQPGIEDRRNAMEYTLSLQNTHLEKYATLTVNAGYDSYHDRLVNGYGIMVPLREEISLLGEYYPVWDRDSAADVQKQYLGKYDAYAFGIKLSTWGHQFMFQLGNSIATSPATMALGTDDTGLKLGFNIQRRF